MSGIRLFEEFTPVVDFGMKTVCAEAVRAEVGTAPVETVQSRSSACGEG
jgi:hypothetical protein